MELRKRILDYFLITSFVWAMYLAWLIPFMLFYIGLEWDQFINWLVTGTLFEMVFTYPIAKAIAKYSPRITAWVEKHG